MGAVLVCRRHVLLSLVRNSQQRLEREPVDGASALQCTAEVVDARAVVAAQLELGEVGVRV
jgi:hypothetical protein